MYMHLYVYLYAYMYIMYTIMYMINTGLQVMHTWIPQVKKFKEIFKPQLKMNNI